MIDLSLIKVLVAATGRWRTAIVLVELAIGDERTSTTIRGLSTVPSSVKATVAGEVTSATAVVASLNLVGERDATRWCGIARPGHLLGHLDHGILDFTDILFHI